MSTEPSTGPARRTSEIATKQYLMFALGDEVFAIDIRTVREIIQFGAITVVPLMPAFVRGVINLRGSVVPVIDLRVRFERSRSDAGKKTCVIIFDTMLADERVELGLLVDSVSEVVDIADDRIEPPPHFGSTIKREFIGGLGKVAGAFVVIIEPERALSIEDMAMLVEQRLSA